MATNTLRKIILDALKFIIVLNNFLIINFAKLFETLYFDIFDLRVFLLRPRIFDAFN